MSGYNLCTCVALGESKTGVAVTCFETQMTPPVPGISVAVYQQQVDNLLPDTPEPTMGNFSAVIERCPNTNLFVGFVPGFPGAHSQGETLDKFKRNLHEVITMLVEDGEPVL